MVLEQDPRYQDAIAFHQNGQIDDAWPLYETLYKRYPYHANLLASLGTCRLQRGDTAGGLPLLEQALSYAPTLDFARGNYASALATLGRHPEALAQYEQLPPSREVLANKAGVLVNLQRLDEALACLEQALRLDDASARVHHDYASVLARLERKEEAMASYRRTLELDPGHVDAYVNLAKLLSEHQHYTEAAEHLRLALALAPMHPRAYGDLAAALHELGQDDDAIALIEDFLPRYPCKELWLRLAFLHYSQRHYQDALMATEEALAMDANYAAAWAYRGFVLVAMRQLDEARRSYDKALSFNPDGNDENWARALITLMSGDFLTGWQFYEWRWHRDEGKVYVNQWPKAPKWLGEWSLQGKTLLVIAEQGMGDTLQFCRFIPAVIALSATVKLVVQKPLVKLLRSLHTEVQVYTYQDPIGAFDFFTPLLSLPLALKLTLHTIPCRPYLKVDEEQVAHWREVLGPATRPRYGLTWSSNPHPKSDHKRTMPLDTLAPLLALDADFYVLQKDIRAGDDLTKYPNLHRLEEALNGFDRTAALAMAMDRVITTDTSIPHLTGALGIPTWMMIPYHACFRWLLDRDDSPWYPTMRLFRQDAPGDWETVVSRVVEALS